MQCVRARGGKESTGRGRDVIDDIQKGGKRPTKPPNSALKEFYLDMRFDEN